MNTIFQNLTDPSWWFTGLFFVVIAYIFPKLVQSRTKVTVHVNGWKKRLKLKRLRKIKAIRFDDTKVVVEGVRASTWQVIFVLTLLLFTYNYFTTQIFISSQNKLSSISFILYAIPVYIIEIIFILQQNFYKKLLQARDKLRITSRSSRTGYHPRSPNLSTLVASTSLPVPYVKR